MPSVTVNTTGDFTSLTNYLSSLISGQYARNLDRYGQMGVEALRAATPVDTGLTADSWTYEIKRGLGEFTIEWHNTNVVDNVNIAIIIQYGHGTRNGGYVLPRDYINPALKPVYEAIERDFSEVISR